MLSKEILSQLYSEENVQSLKINDQLLYMVQKGAQETWGSYFFNHFPKKYNNLSWGTLKKTFIRRPLGHSLSPLLFTRNKNVPLEKE